MASSSTASVHQRFKYDVFLSFRGEDTRKNFIDHLYYALRQKGVDTYKDDEAIKKGNFISNELIRSIEDSKYYIIVFSKNYAASSWCLNELLKILECHQMTEHTAYPVFYDVEPTEVRNQTGVVGEAFAKHKNDEASGKWKNALKEASDLAGWELKNTANGHEAQFIQKIVKEISEKLPSINLSIDNKLVGMETRVNNVVSILETNIDDVRMIGIWGIGGGGKTTLARAVLNQISFQFECTSFVENVREVSNNSSSGLKSLQKQVLSNVLNDRDINVDGVYDGIGMMKKMIRHTKVLLVLDDVDHIKQLEALAGEPDWFKPGSRIIVTTRDNQVLKAHRVKSIVDVKLLSFEEQICLFNRYAFEREIPFQGYEELSEQVINYAQGLPLTIRVLGSLLCGKKDKSEWRDTLERLKKIPLDETLKIMELSYENLEEDYKEIFLDVACFLKGCAKIKVIQVLESCGFHARNGLRVLEHKSLITIDDYRGNECVGMHDHIEEMGKNIVHRSHPKPHKRSRLWNDEEIIKILANDSGTKATRSLRFYIEKVNPEIMNGFRKMKELRFLDVFVYDNGHFPSYVSQYFPDALQYLSWYGYPFIFLPKTFEADNLVALVMISSKIVQLWKGRDRKVLKKLKFLNLSYSSIRTLDLGLIPNLEALSLRGCHSLVKLHMLDGCPKLISIDLSQSKLRTLDLEFFPNLEVLSLESCAFLVQLHKLGGCMNLKSVNLNDTKLKIVDLHSALNLELLHLNYCNALVELHLPDGCLKLTHLHCKVSKLMTFDIRLALNLETLILDKSGDLVTLQMPGECLNLRTLKLTNSNLRTLDIRLALNLETLILDESGDLVTLQMPGKCLNLRTLKLTNSKLRTLDIGLTPNLEDLDLKNSYDLEELHMAGKCQKLESLNISRSKLRTLDLGLTPNLKNLDLKECNNLVQVHVPTGCLENISYLDLSGCLRFTSFLFEKWPLACSRMDESLEGGPSAELHLIAESLERCPLHPYNTSQKFQFECYYKDDPSLTGNINTLICVGLCAGTNLETFSQSISGLQRLKKLTIDGYPEAPRDLDHLEFLEHLHLSSLLIEHLPDSICMLKHLKYLELDSCWFLQKLPENLGQLECLEELILSSKNIKQIPDSICMLKNLKVLKLSDCIALEKLPEDLGLLECLVMLNLSRTKIKYLPDTFCMLKGLRCLYLDHCSLFEKLPEDLDRLEYLELLSLVQCTFLEDIPNSVCEMKCLKELHIEGTCIDYLPQSIHLLKGLRIHGSRGLLQACGFTSFLYGESCYVDV